MEGDDGRAGRGSVMKMKIIIHPAEDGGFWAEVPGFPGCVSEGDTVEETRANIREAFEGVFEVMQDHHDIHPEDRTQNDRVEVIEV
jgi:predicted RNase H-like HicB family nuclease